MSKSSRKYGTYVRIKEAKKIIGGITGSEILMSENNEELMTIYNYMERILNTLK